MTPFKERRCRACGEGRVRLLAQPGRTTMYKFLECEVPAELEIPTCDHCGSEWHDDHSAMRFDQAMEAVFRADLLALAQRAIARIEGHAIRQSEVERVLGLSAGYLSKLKRGERSPEPALVSELMLVATDPAQRLAEVQEGWKTRLLPAS